MMKANYVRVTHNCLARYTRIITLSDKMYYTALIYFLGVPSSLYPPILQLLDVYVLSAECRMTAILRVEYECSTVAE